jgi:hypothetical protein
MRHESTTTKAITNDHSFTECRDGGVVILIHSQILARPAPLAAHFNASITGALASYLRPEALMEILSLPSLILTQGPKQHQSST